MSGGRKIVLHIGLHKTGTTSIQNVLHANRDFLLAEEAALYPSLAPNLSSALLTIFRDDPRKLKANKVAGFTMEEIAVRREQYLNSLDEEISSGGWDTLLLSAEGVSLLAEPELAKLREWGEKYSTEWVVLVCVRHPVDWTRSVVQERLKQGDTLRQLYAKPPTPRYSVRISKAMNVFGGENVRVFDFESAIRGEGGIVKAFTQQAGLSASSGELLASRTGRYNESLSLEAARVLDSMNRQRPILVGNARAPRRAGPGRELAYIRRIKGRKFDVPEWVKEDVRSLSREDVGWLNETFGLDLYRDVVEFTPREDQEDQEEQAQDQQEQQQGREQAREQEEKAEGGEEGLAGEGPAEALSDPAVDSIVEIIGELVTENAFHRALNQGREALGRGDMDRGVRMLREAARLDPEAPQPEEAAPRSERRQTAGRSGRQSSERQTAEEVQAVAQAVIEGAGSRQAWMWLRACTPLGGRGMPLTSAIV